MRQMLTKQPFTALDLFCGAGGLSSGFVKAGFVITHSVDYDDSALKTYNANFGEHAGKIDLLNDDVDLPSATVVMGGPPCQGFSSAGLRKTNDHRNSLVSSFAKII